MNITKTMRTITTFILLVSLFALSAMSVLAQTPVHEITWGQRGTADGEFWSPVGIAQDSLGNVYVAEGGGNQRIQKFDSDGNFILKWGSSGSGVGQFSSPWGIAVDSLDNVYVADSQNDRIQKFDSNGNFILTWGTFGTGNGQFNIPIAIAIDAFDNVYVTDDGNHRVQKFDSSGNFILGWGSFCDAYQGTGPGCVDPVTLLSCVPVPTNPLDTCGDGQFQGVRGIAVNDAGTFVYVSDVNNRRIQKFTSTGTFVLKWGQAGIGPGQFGNTRGVDVDASGNIYTSDGDANRVAKYDSNGNFILEWGSVGVADGQFMAPKDVVVDDSANKIYVVSDSGEDRVQRFSLGVAPVCGDGAITGGEVCDILGDTGCLLGETCNACVSCDPIPTPQCPGDMDGDGDVDLDDTVLANDCFSTGIYAGICVNADLNGDFNIDLIDAVTFSGIPQGPCPSAGICGDADGSGQLDIADFVAITNYVGNPAGFPTICTNTTLCNVDGNTVLDLADATYLQDYIFSGGPAPNCAPVTGGGDVCGDGAVTGAEVCDTLGDLGCLLGETCDACTSCLPPAQVCGDGVVTGTETCDIAGDVGCVSPDICDSCTFCIPSGDDDGDGIINTIETLLVGDSVELEPTYKSVDNPVWTLNPDNSISISGDTPAGTTDITTLPPGTTAEPDMEINVERGGKKVTISGVTLPAGETKTVRVQATRWFNFVCIRDRPDDVVVNKQFCFNDESQSRVRISCNGAVNTFTGFPDGTRNFQCTRDGDFLEVAGLQHTVLESFSDFDGDGIFDHFDNCPFTPNPDQTDLDENGIGDACEPYLSECVVDIQICGNGVTETCDPSNPAVGCNIDEQCDDGNLIPGDGCDEFCQLECDDEDGDGYGVEILVACENPGIDCNDDDPEIFPGVNREVDFHGFNSFGICRPRIEQCNGATGLFDIVVDPGQAPETEVCDGLDNDCDQSTDENDALAPTTTDDAPLGWQNVDVLVTLTPADNPATPDACGVDQTFYCVDQTDTCTPTTPGTAVSVTAEGVNYVRYYSVDNFVGNTEAVQSAVVLIDKTPPVTTKLVLDEDADGSEDAAILTCVDDTTNTPDVSGCDSITYILNGVPTTTTCADPFDCEVPVDLSGGFIDISFNSVDIATNVELPTSQTHLGDECPTGPGPADTAPTEYVFEVLDFQSNVGSVTAPRVFLGKTEITNDPTYLQLDGKYHIPLRAPSGAFIVDDRVVGASYGHHWWKNKVPKGVWVIERQGPQLLSGLYGQFWSSNDDVYMETRGTFDGDISVSNYRPKPFERQGDNIAIPLNSGQDEYTVTGMTILSEATVDRSSDFQKVKYEGIPETPEMGVTGPTEYVLDILDFQSTAPGITAPRVFAGNTEVFPEPDGLYHIPILDENGSVIIDNTDYNALPKGIWIVDRQGEVTSSRYRHGDDDDDDDDDDDNGHGHGGKLSKLDRIVAGLRGDGTGSGTYVYYKTNATLDGAFGVVNYHKNRFERAHDGSATPGSIGRDEFNRIGDSILAEASVRPKSDYYMIEFADLRGCPVGDKTEVKMHIIDLEKSGVCGYRSNGKARKTCTIQMEDIPVKIFDRKDTDFVTTYGTSNPSKNLYDDIFEADIGLVGSCTTDVQGGCLAPEDHPGKFLVIAKLNDTDAGLTVYHGRNKNFKSKRKHSFHDEDDDDDDDDWHNGYGHSGSSNSGGSATALKDRIAFKQLRFVKLIKRNGDVKYRGSHRVVIEGSELTIDAPEFVVWHEDEELYPFIFSSAEDWQLDVCMQVPDGYEIAGILDDNDTVLTTADCTQTLVAEEDVILLFRVLDLESPEPNFGFSMTAGHDGELTTLSEDVQGIRTATEDIVEAAIDNKIELFEIERQRRAQAEAEREAYEARLAAAKEAEAQKAQAKAVAEQLALYEPTAAPTAAPRVPRPATEAQRRAAIPTRAPEAGCSLFGLPCSNVVTILFALIVVVLAFTILRSQQRK